MRVSVAFDAKITSWDLGVSEAATLATGCLRQVNAGLLFVSERSAEAAWAKQETARTLIQQHAQVSCDELHCNIALSLPAYILPT